MEKLGRIVPLLWFVFLVPGFPGAVILEWLAQKLRKNSRLSSMGEFMFMMFACAGLFWVGAGYFVIRIFL